MQKVQKRRAIAGPMVAASLCWGVHSHALAACAAVASSDIAEVASVVDARTLRLSDGRDIRLAGIEPAGGEADRDRSRNVLAALGSGRAVVIHILDDAPDRYGRQAALVLIAAEGPSLQTQLVRAGAALASPFALPSDCLKDLLAAEDEAKRARRGIWATAALKNAERSDDILARNGQFTVIEGRVASVRQSGTITYLNFGRRRADNLAATIPRQIAASMADMGVSPQTLAGRHVEVRGWVQTQGGRPRIAISHAGQIRMAPAAGQH